MCVQFGALEARTRFGMGWVWRISDIVKIIQGTYTHGDARTRDRRAGYGVDQKVGAEGEVVRGRRNLWQALWGSAPGSH
jgi:hypothetical protein